LNAFDAIDGRPNAIDTNDAYFKKSLCSQRREWRSVRQNILKR
jgi:hypothetical protein